LSRKKGLTIDKKENKIYNETEVIEEITNIHDRKRKMLLTNSSGRFRTLTGEVTDGEREK